MRYPLNAPNGDEEDLNQQVTSHFYYSLKEGSTLVNKALQDIPISFSNDASVVAHQDSPLPKNSNTQKDREIDWVIRDEDKLVGFESKYGAPLKKKQLRDELKKLRMNADDQDIYLVTITHHPSKPSIINKLDGDCIYWTNWISVSKRVKQIDEDKLPAEQRIPLQMLKDLFEVENMNPFTGFDHQDKNQYRYFIRDLIPEMNEVGLENRGKVHTWTQNKADPSGYARIVPKYIAVPFVEENRPPLNEEGRPQSKRASVFLTVVDTEEHKVYAGVVFGIMKVPGHRRMLRKNGEEIIKECHSDGFEMWFGRNSINNRSLPPKKTRGLEEMKRWMTEENDGKGLLEDPDIRKVWFLRECTGEEPPEMFSSIVKTIGEQRERFLKRDDFVKLDSLVAPDTME
ncbi:hypothetical protein ACEU6E_10540 (plasmid) [Halorutilales archaeon Cl-col2-1]